MWTLTISPLRPFLSYSNASVVNEIRKGGWKCKGLHMWNTQSWHKLCEVLRTEARVWIWQELTQDGILIIDTRYVTLRIDKRYVILKIDTRYVILRIDTRCHFKNWHKICHLMNWHKMCHFKNWHKMCHFKNWHKVCNMTRIDTRYVTWQELTQGM